MSNKDHTHESRKSLKERLDQAGFRVTLASTVVAVVAAIAALWSGYEAHKTRVQDERPFLAVDVVPPGKDDVVIPVTPLNSNARTHVVAFGKTPAKDIHVTCASVRQNAPAAMWKPNAHYSSSRFTYILPGRFVEIFCSMQTDPPVDTTAPEFELGLVQYRGEDGTSYQTPFCYQFIQFGSSPLVIRQCTEDHGQPELR